MISELVDKAQRMYDSHRYTMAEIAQYCAVSPTTIYRHIHTGQPDISYFDLKSRCVAVYRKTVTDREDALDLLS
jgi:predicted DNA-binding protein YlxM (UPF0122 family)